jgi:hypothetical protein
VQESLEVMMTYFLIDPQFGHDLQKITDEANRRLPLIWWHDLEADVEIAEEEFERLVAGLQRNMRREKSGEEVRKSENCGIVNLFRSCIEFVHRLF